MNGDKINFVHKYRRYARRGWVPVLTHSCGGEYTTRIDDNGDIFFQCFACGTRTDLGLAEIKAMEAHVADYKAKRNQ